MCGKPQKYTTYEARATKPNGAVAFVMSLWNTIRTFTIAHNGNTSQDLLNAGMVTSAKTVSGMAEADLQPKYTILSLLKWTFQSGLMLITAYPYVIVATLKDTLKRL